ncbi:hypothetical protein CsSME_00002806 [Camellia sinensis var. sinensis]
MSSCSAHLEWNLDGLLDKIWEYLNLTRIYTNALVWGSSAKHKPQRVGKEHELEDEDVVQIIKKV